LAAGRLGLADEAAKAEGTGAAGEIEELPTMPPAPRSDKPGLRWATPGPGAPRGREQGRRLRPEPLREAPTAPVLVPPRSPGPTPGRGSPAYPAGQDEEQARDEDGTKAGGRGTSHRRLSALLVLVGLLCALAGVAVVVVWRVGDDKVAPSPAPSTSPPGRSPEQVLESLLATGATAQALVQNAIDGGCRTTTPQSRARAGLIAEIGHAGAIYRQVLARVQADQELLSQMPGGLGLSTDLVGATGASARAATAYGDWLEDLQATGCYSAPTNDLHYREATAAAVGAAVAAARLEAQLRENPLPRP